MNVDQSSELLAEHKGHVNQLKSLLENQDDGPVKQELLRVLENSEKHVKTLEDHINHGHDLVK